MPTRMLLFDLDDTLLTSEKIVSKSSKDAIKLCKDMGMLIGYITARSPRKLDVFLEGLPCDCIACYNGAYIYSGKLLLESNLIPYDSAIKIMSEIKEAYPKSKVGAYLEPYSYFDGEIRNIETKETKNGGIMDLPRHNFQRIRIVFDKDDNIHLTPFMSNQTIYYVTSDGTAMIINKNANKEHCLRVIANHFMIPLSDVAAFGDDINDCDMLKAAGIGVAMGNAINNLKEIADYVTETNDNDGISKWITANLLTERTE